MFLIAQFYKGWHTGDSQTVGPGKAGRHEKGEKHDDHTQGWNT